MSQRPRFMEDDEDDRLARRTTRLSWAIPLLLLGACLFSLFGCTSTSEHVGDATLTGAAAAAGSFISPLVSGVLTFIVSLWTSVTGTGDLSIPPPPWQVTLGTRALVVAGLVLVALLIAANWVDWFPDLLRCRRKTRRG